MSVGAFPARIQAIHDTPTYIVQYSNWAHAHKKALTRLAPSHAKCPWCAFSAYKYNVLSCRRSEPLPSPGSSRPPFARLFCLSLSSSQIQNWIRHFDDDGDYFRLRIDGASYVLSTEQRETLGEREREREGGGGRDWGDLDDETCRSLTRARVDRGHNDVDDDYQC